MTECYEINGKAQRQLGELRLELFDLDVVDRNEVLEKAIDIAYKQVIEKSSESVELGGDTPENNTETSQKV